MKKLRSCDAYGRPESEGNSCHSAKGIHCFAGETGDIDIGLATPMELFQSIAAEGYQMSHRRVPLSRERTPEAADLDVLHQQALIRPEGKVSPSKDISQGITACRLIIISI